MFSLAPFIVVILTSSPRDIATQTEFGWVVLHVVVKPRIEALYTGYK